MTVCGGAFNTFDRMIRILISPLCLMGVDVFFNDRRSTYSVVKHVDRAMRQCLRQWLSAEGMPKHQQLGSPSRWAYPSPITSSSPTTPTCSAA